MPDQPEMTNGTRQPSGHFAVRFDLNQGFNDQVGQAKADECVAVLMEVADGFGHEPMDVIERELAPRVKGIGIHPHETELRAFADQINRSDAAVHPDQPNAYDPQ